MTDKKPPAQPTLSASVSQQTYDFIETAAANGYRTKAQQVRLILNSWVEWNRSQTNGDDPDATQLSLHDEGVQ